MNTDVENIVLEILKDLQRRSGEQTREIRFLRDDMREGFASVRAALQAQQHDINLLERRMERVEDDVRLIKRATEFPEDVDT